GILTVGIVTKPFAFEGKRKMSIAEQGIANLMMHVDSLIVIPNERLKLISQEKITLMNAFEAADNVLRQGVESISSLINVPAFINLDFADVRSIMKDAGFAHMGVGVAKGAGKAENAAKAAISSPLLETSIAGARGVIINITSSPDIGLDDVETAASMITQSAHPDANIIWGTAFDERLQDEMSITVVATGFESTPGVDEPIQAAMDAQKAAAAAAAPAAPKAEAPKAKPAVDPVIPNPVFSNVFNPNVDTPVSTTPVSQPEPAEEDDGDYFNDLLSILNKRS
ncbi:cell division protein FtsZ, partial [bacterium]|nr:cell division protein FtsZ [bacterium]